MIYKERDYSEIFELMLNDSLEKGLISHAEDFPDLIANREDISNYYIMDKSVIAYMFEWFFQNVATPIYESAKVEYAEGIDLDSIGKWNGVPRPSATKSTVLERFSLTDSLDEDISIPAGIILTTSSGVEYETSEELYIAAGNVETTIQCRSIGTGPDTKIAEDTLTSIVSSIGYDLICTNVTRSSGGNPAYTDDEYRFLLMNWIKIMLKGSDEAYLNYFANKDGVDDYRIVPNWDDSGTIKIIVDPGDSLLLNEIYNELRSSVCQEDTVITLFAPTERTISIYAKVNVDIDLINPYSDLEMSDIQSRIVSAIKVFIDGGYINTDEGRVWYQGLGLVEDFIPHKLAVFLDDAIPELKNITFTTPSDYISIADDEKCVSDEIVIEMI